MGRCVLKMNKLSDSEKKAAIDFLNDQLKQISEKNPEIEIDFECACASGDVDKVEKYLDTVPYLTKYPEYIQGVIGYTEDMLNYVFDESTNKMIERVDKNSQECKNIEKVLTILRTRPDCQS